MNTQKLLTKHVSRTYGNCTVKRRPCGFLLELETALAAYLQQAYGEKISLRVFIAMPQEDRSFRDGFSSGCWRGLVGLHHGGTHDACLREWLYEDILEGLRRAPVWIFINQRRNHEGYMAEVLVTLVARALRRKSSKTKSFGFGHRETLAFIPEAPRISTTRPMLRRRQKLRSSSIGLARERMSRIYQRGADNGGILTCRPPNGGCRHEQKWMETGGFA